jgi:hypothetical protein
VPQEPGCIVYQLGRAFWSLRDFLEDDRYRQMDETERKQRASSIAKELGQVRQQHPSSLLALKLHVDIGRLILGTEGYEGVLREALDHFKARQASKEAWADPKGDLAVWDGYDKTSDTAKGRQVDLAMGLTRAYKSYYEGYPGRHQLKLDYDGAKAALGLIPRAELETRKAKQQLVRGPSTAVPAPRFPPIAAPAPACTARLHAGAVALPGAG